MRYWGMELLRSYQNKEILLHVFKTWHVYCISSLLSGSVDWQIFLIQACEFVSLLPFAESWSRKALDSLLLRSHFWPDGVGGGGGEVMGGGSVQGAAQILNIPRRVARASGRNQNKGISHKSASNTPDQLSAKQRAWNWTAIGFAAVKTQPVDNKRIREILKCWNWDLKTMDWPVQVLLPMPSLLSTPIPSSRISST